MGILKSSVVAKLREDCSCNISVNDLQNSSLQCNDAQTVTFSTLVVFSSDSGDETASTLVSRFSSQVSASAISLDLNGSEVLITSASSSNSSESNVGAASTSESNVGAASTSESNVGAASTSESNVGAASTSESNVGAASTSESNVGAANSSESNVGAASTSESNVGAASTSESNVGADSTNVGADSTSEPNVGAANSSESYIGVYVGLFFGGALSCAFLVALLIMTVFLMYQ